MRYVCSICGATFKNMAGLFGHKRLAHQQTPEEARRNPLVEVWRCPECGNDYSSSSVLYRHIRLVHGLEPFEDIWPD